MATAGTPITVDANFLHVPLVVAAGATTSTVYFDLGVWGKEVAIHVQGITTATVQIWGDSVSTTLPTADTNATQIGANITADAHVTITGCPRYIAAKVSAWTSGTVNVYLVSHRD